MGTTYIGYSASDGHTSESEYEAPGAAWDALWTYARLNAELNSEITSAAKTGYSLQTETFTGTDSDGVNHTVAVVNLDTHTRDGVDLGWEDALIPSEPATPSFAQAYGEAAALAAYRSDREQARQSSAIEAGAEIDLEALREEYRVTRDRFHAGRPHLHRKLTELRAAIDATESTPRYDITIISTDGTQTVTPFPVDAITQDNVNRALRHADQLVADAPGSTLYSVLAVRPSGRLYRFTPDGAHILQVPITITADDRTGFYTELARLTGRDPNRIRSSSIGSHVWDDDTYMGTVTVS